MIIKVSVSLRENGWNLDYSGREDFSYPSKEEIIEALAVEFKKTLAREELYPWIEYSWIEYLVDVQPVKLDLRPWWKKLLRIKEKEI